MRSIPRRGMAACVPRCPCEVYQEGSLMLDWSQDNVDRSQDGKAPGPVPRRGPPYATGCDSDSDSLAMARGEQSRATGHLLHIAHWNAERPTQQTARPARHQSNLESWIICGDFKSLSSAWGYKNFDAKAEDVEDWMTSNNLILINIPYDEPTYFSRVWNTTSTPDLAAATDDIQKVT
ncbi:hypothetical protein RRG08_056975 [Elysia crispata]|uniref:Endonuclease/exonuclease/phosphatase domain-containing protein n=1 Tax=Elysia crispata TaxID=231223 RepID=A0AAE0Z777_9GAST|nr:hypothetical protein RRG08_056975 [Elysia crispata]